MKWNGIKLHFHNNLKFGDNTWLSSQTIFGWWQRKSTIDCKVCNYDSLRQCCYGSECRFASPLPSIFGYNDTHTHEFPECLRKLCDTINCVSIVSNGIFVRIFDWYLVAHHFSECGTAIRSTLAQHSTPWRNTFCVELICF